MFVVNVRLRRFLKSSYRAKSRNTRHKHKCEINSAKYYEFNFTDEGEENKQIERESMVEQHRHARGMRIPISPYFHEGSCSHAGVVIAISIGK